MSIAQRVALVTGSARGIGRAIALRLARDGFDVALNDVPSRRDCLDSLADDVAKVGRKSVLVPADVSVEEEVKGMIKEAVKELGSLDVMVANAGIGHLSSLTSTELDDWERVMATNARAPFLCYKYAAQQMIKQGRGGRILGASSMTGKTGIPLCGPYSASKWAIRGLTQTAALELGRYGITVNAYAPGAIKTPLTDGLGAIMARMLESDDAEHMQWNLNYLESVPIKIEGQPDHVASLVSYLASEEATFITGQCISVDGGITMS